MPKNKKIVVNDCFCRTSHIKEKCKKNPRMPKSEILSLLSESDNIDEIKYILNVIIDKVYK